MYKITIRIVMLLLLSLPALAQIDVRDLAVLEDRDGTATIQTIATLPDTAFSPRPNGLSEGFSRSVHWLRFTAQAPSGQAGQWWLEIHPTYLDDIRLFEPDPARPGAFIERQTGDRFPFVEREAPYRGFVFRVALAESETRTFHLRLQTTSTSLMMIKAWPVQQFEAAALGEYMLLGAAFGLLAIILAINLMYWWYQRESLNLRYFVYISAIIVNSTFVQGFAAQFLLPEQPLLVNDLQNLSSFLTTSAAAYLYQGVLMLDQRPRVFLWLYRILAWLPLLLIPAIPLGHFTEAQRTVIGYATFLAPIAVGLSIKMLRERVAGGALLVVAGMFSALTIGMAILQIQGYFAGNFIILHAFLIGTIGNVIALHLAIGARYRAQAMLQQQTAAQGRLSELKAEREMRGREEQSRFISMIAHEIKTPLASVVAASDVLEILNKTSTPEVKDRIERIRRSAHRIDGIFNRYLQMDRSDKARSRPNFMEHSLYQVVKLAVSHFTGETLRLRLHLGDDVRLVCDADLISTAMLNLIDNAMKYSPTDEGVELSTRLHEGHEVIIDIVDHGPGVSADLGDAIFERYVRSPEHANIPGTGVGLSLVREIAMLHQGRIEVLTDEGGGARFRLTLPIRMAGAMSGIDS